MLADYYIIYAFEERSVALIPVGHGVHVCGCLVLCVCVCVCVRPRTFFPILDLARASVCIPELCNVLCCYLKVLQLLLVACCYYYYCCYYCCCCCQHQRSLIYNPTVC